jgi:hypothetical protein
VATVRRYAEGTSVDVSKTKSEIDRLLIAHSCTQRAIAVNDATRLTILTFRFQDRIIKLQMASDSSRDERKREQKDREAWRRLLLLLKAKFESIRSGDSSLEQEFLANVMLPDGRTVADEVRESIALAYSTGQVSRLLPAFGEP